MNALLYFPGIVIVIMLAAGLEKVIRTVVIITEVQVLPSVATLTIGYYGNALHTSICAKLCFQSI
jgi:ABC-type dipeptide/oligopeptide/nickel transport system permease subunit